VAVGLGLLFASVGQLIALQEASYGRQWATPSHYSWIMFIAYPFAIWRLRDAERESIAPEVMLLIGAVVADIVVAKAAFSIEAFYDATSPANIFCLLWLAFWLFWQALPIWTMTRRPDQAMPSRAQFLKMVGLSLIGIALAAVAEFVAVMLNFGGEGWGTPSLVSLVLFLGFPVALIRIYDTQNHDMRGDILLLVVAGLADVYLLVQTQTEYRYFLRSFEGGAAGSWLFFWLLWHALLVATIAIKLRRRVRL